MLLAWHLSQQPENAPKDRVTLSAYPPTTIQGGSVRITVKWPRERDNLDGALYWQLPYPGEGGHATRELDGAPRQFVRVFDRLPSGMARFVAETCERGTDRCETAELMVEVK